MANKTALGGCGGKGSAGRAGARPRLPPSRSGWWGQPCPAEAALGALRAGGGGRPEDCEGRIDFFPLFVGYLQDFVLAN